MDTHYFDPRVRTTFTIVIASLTVFALISGCTDPRASTDADTPGATVNVDVSVADTEIVDVPDTGISLGWGWNTYDNRAVPSICIEFAEGREPAQTQTVSIKEVSDNFEVMQHIGITAEASVSTIGVEASGKAAFAKDVNITGFASNFMLNASVQNGVRYASPVPAKGQQLPAGVTPLSDRGGAGGEIRLTDAALKLASLKDPGQFQKACGDSFVSSVFSGAKMTALITINESSHAEQEKLSAQMSGSGWGVSLSASAEENSEEKSSSKDSSVSVFLTGGRNEAIPSDAKEVVAAAKRLAVMAFEAPKDFSMAITPYQALANWPTQTTLVGEESEFDQLASRWGSFNTIYDEIQYALDNPDQFYFLTQVMGTAKPVDPASPEYELALEHLEHLQDEALTIVRELSITAADCAENAENKSDQIECKFDHTLYPDPYRYRIQLPLPRGVTGRVTDAIAILDQQRADYVTQRDRLNSQASKQRETDRINAIDKAKSALAAWADSDADVVADIGTHALRYHVIDKVKRRCSIDVHNLGCLTNAEIRTLSTLVGKELSYLDDGRNTVAPKSISAR